MALDKKTGKDCKITLGTYKITGMGKWDMPGITTDLLESTEFGDQWKQYLLGLKDGGEITFDGFFIPDDSQGQAMLRTANLDGSQLTNLYFYVDNTSYFGPTTTNPLSYFLIRGWKVGADKSGLVTGGFTAKLSGAIQLN